MIEQSPQLGDCTGQLRACADQRHRLRRLLQQSDDRVGESAIGLGFGRTRMRRELHRPGEFLLRLQHVGRNVDDHRTRTSAARPMKSFGNRLGNFIDGANQPAPLRKRESHAEDVGLLETRPYRSARCALGR